MPPEISTARHQRLAAVAFDYAPQPKRVVTSCNLCGTDPDRFVVVALRDRYGYPATACGCLRCGLVFLNPVMTAEAYGSFYARTYRPLVSAYHGRQIDARTIQSEQREYAAERAALLAPYLQNHGERALLDIGGSTGVVAHEFARRFGLRATVLDPAPLEIAEAQRLGVNTITALLEEYVPERRYDAVIMCQTVDHLLDVAGAMRKVRQLLADGGVFFVDIVDFRAACLRAGAVEDAIKIDHPYYLTDFTMRACLARAGLDIIRMAHASDTLHIGYVCRAGTVRPDALPPSSYVEAQWRELQSLQHAGSH